MSRGFNLDDYVTVQDRIRQFWADHPNGRIHTEIMSDPTDYQSCRYVARVYRDIADEHPAATGWAFEHATERGPNLTSHEENCETSAIGRALANMGYATSQKDRPSREEMAKVQRGPRAAQDEGSRQHQATESDIQRITTKLKGPLTTGAYNLLLREIEQLGISDVPEISILMTEVEQRRAAAAQERRGVARERQASLA